MSIWRLSDTRDSNIIRLMFSVIALGGSIFLLGAGLLSDENRGVALFFGGLGALRT